MSYCDRSSTASFADVARSRTSLMARVVNILSLPVLWSVGVLSRVRTAMETPLSFIPSRHMNGDRSDEETLALNEDSGSFTDMLSSAAKATDLRPPRGEVLTSMDEVSSLKS